MHVNRYATLYGFGCLAAIACWLGMWISCFKGDRLGATLCGQAGMGGVWFAMHMARHARQAIRELKMKHATEVIGSLLPQRQRQ